MDITHYRNNANIAYFKCGSELKCGQVHSAVKNREALMKVNKLHLTLLVTVMEKKSLEQKILHIFVVFVVRLKKKLYK